MCGGTGVQCQPLASTYSTKEIKVEILTVIVKVGALMFIVSSMLAMGFSLTVPQIIAPLKNMR